MKDNFNLFDPIQVEGKCAVMTGEDTDVKATQFRGSDETLAGSFHKDHVRIAYDRPPEPRRGGQNSKRDVGTTRIVPRIVVAEQWLCFLLGLICMICGVCGLFMKYKQDSPFAYIRWLGPAHGPILRSTAIACFVVGAVLVRCGLASPDQSLVSIDQKPLRSVRANLARASNLFSAWGPILGFGLKWRGKDHHERRHI
jgi:hypothetical protein